MKLVVKLACVTILYFSMPLSLYAETFECAFIQDKYSKGKSNMASCSMLPEKVYSTKWHSPDKGEHCNIKEVLRYEDIEDFLVEIDAGYVTFVKHIGYTDDAKQRLKEHYIQEGRSQAEAEKSVNSENKFEEFALIKSHTVSQQTIDLDSVTLKRLDLPRKIPEHHFILDGMSTYYLYIPESSGHAILIEPTGMEDCSWVNIRFGKCRKIDKK